MRTDSPQDAAPQDVSHVRLWFVLVASLTAVWIVGLGVLSLLTANPVTLNRDQILDSVDVLTAVVEDPRAGRIRIEKSWKGFVEQEQLVARATWRSSGSRRSHRATCGNKGWIRR